MSRNRISFEMGTGGLMHIALVTTTINPPLVLELYRALGPEVEFFIAGDLKSPHNDIQLLCKKLGNANYLHPDTQQKWKCSEFIAWNCIQRRNIAVLEALKWGADIICSVDTDDFPLPGHFQAIERLLTCPFSGIELRAASTWVDPGWLVYPPASHRGMPVKLDRFYCHPAVGRYIGAAASTVLGSCDISAVDRLAGFEKRHCASEMARSGAIIDPATSHTLFNSEAVAFVRELAPAFMMVPSVGRYDDLFASLIAQRVMKELGYCVHVGQPIVWHEREDRNLIHDLKNEIYGMENILLFPEWIDSATLKNRSPVEMVRRIWENLEALPVTARETALAWCDDVESVL